MLKSIFYLFSLSFSLCIFCLVLYPDTGLWVQTVWLWVQTVFFLFCTWGVLLFLHTWLGVQRSCQVLDTVLWLSPSFQLVLFLYCTRGSCPVPCCTMSADRQPVSFSLLVKRVSCPISVYWAVWVETTCLLVLFLLNIYGVLAFTWKLSYECRHPVSMSFSCWTFLVSCLVPGNWAMSADTLSACPISVEHFWCPVLYLEIEL